MIEIKRELKPSNFVNIGDGLTIRRRIEATVSQDDHLNWSANRDSTVRLIILWSDDEFTYEVRELTVVAPTGAGPVTGTALRSIPVQLILKMCINRAILAKGAEKKFPLLVPINNEIIRDDELLTRLAAKGPHADTLLWVARIYTLAKIKLDPPAQYVSDMFEVPLRTASHWIKLARERGHLTI